MLPVISHDRNKGLRISRRFFTFTVTAAVVFAGLLCSASLIREVNAAAGDLDTSYGNMGTLVLPTLGRRKPRHQLWPLRSVPYHG